MTFTKSPKEYVVICCHEIAKKVFHPINSINTTFHSTSQKSCRQPLTRLAILTNRQADK